MFSKSLPVSTLVAQGRWTVEFFVADRNGTKSSNYPLVQLKDVLSERREALDPQQYPKHTFHYIGLEHIQSLTGDLVDGYMPRQGREVLSRSKVFREGDLLYGRLRPALNKVFVADGPVPEGICSGEFYVLVPDQERILPHFVRALLASRYVQDVVATMTSGSALPRLALDDLLEVEVPLPSLEVQRQHESFVITQDAKRRELAAELREGPAADIESIVLALEEGTPPGLARPARRAQPDFGCVRLPEVGKSPGRGSVRLSRRR
jgi:hypothetical protein